MTKAKIIQRLLDKKQITAEEAVVLLQNETVSIPIHTPNPYYHTQTPTSPPVWCSTDTITSPTIGDNWEYKVTKSTPPPTEE